MVSLRYKYNIFLITHRYLNRNTVMCMVSWWVRTYAYHSVQKSSISPTYFNALRMNLRLRNTLISPHFQTINKWTNHSCVIKNSYMCAFQDQRFELPFAILGWLLVLVFCEFFHSNLIHETELNVFTKYCEFCFEWF